MAEEPIWARASGGGAAVVVARLPTLGTLMASEAILKSAKRAMHETRAATGKVRHVKANEI